MAISFSGKTPAAESNPARVVLIHGLWMTGREMLLLERRLGKAGFRVCRFSYRSWGDDLEQSAAELLAFVLSLGEKKVHFVCHSLGGLVLNTMLTDCRADLRGRAVLLGSPLAGSRVAQKLQNSRPGRVFVGRKLGALGRGSGPWPETYEVGVIGGTLNLGLGLFFGGRQRPGDGLVAVDEIMAPGIKDVFFLRTTHLGLVFSAACVRQIAYFLKNGSFLYKHPPL